MLFIQVGNGRISSVKLAPPLPIHGVLHEVLTLHLGVLERALIGTVTEDLAEGVGLKDDALDAGFDVLHVAPLQALLVAEEFGYVAIRDEIALFEFLQETDRTAQVLIVYAIVVGDLAPVRDFGPIAQIQRAGTAAGGEVFGSAKRFADILFFAASDSVPSNLYFASHAM